MEPTSRRTVCLCGAWRRAELYPPLTAAQAEHQADEGAECGRGQQQRARGDLRRHVEQPVAEAAGGWRAAAQQRVARGSVRPQRACLGPLGL